MKARKYEVWIRKMITVEVTATSSSEAKDTVRSLYASGDAVADLNGAALDVGVLSVSPIDEDEE